MKEETRLLHSGRDPARFDGAVNPPQWRTSTVIAPTMAEWNDRLARRARDEPGTYYGRLGTPTTQAFEASIAELEGAHRTVVLPSGLAACTVALLGAVGAGDHVLMTDSVYGPVRAFCRGTLKRLGVETTFYDPEIGTGLAALVRPSTRVVYLESPGSLTMEMQDTDAIVEVAHRAGALALMDNTWATPLWFKPLAHGVDLSIQAATKYVVGHSDALIGTVSATKAAWSVLKAAAHELGQTAGPEDVVLAHRGLRTMAIRLARHQASALAVAEWLSTRPEVERVLYPALASDPGHALWQRDFGGAPGLFSLVLRTSDAAAVARFVDGLELFAIGASWGGFESLVLPFDPAHYRTATRWPHAGQALRLHIGLDDPADLIADLSAGLARLGAP